VLMIHGLADYFFQTHVADHFAAGGWDVYGIDLRRFGRSLLSHQTPNFCRSIGDYYPELDAAAEFIRGQGARTLLVCGHSTGGLIAPLWAADRPAGTVDGLFLNSPFLQFPVPWFVRWPALAIVAAVPPRAGRVALPRRAAETYAVATHSSHGGEWSYDLSLKPAAGYPIRLGWLGAIREAHARVGRGLGLGIPVLVGSSGRSFEPRRDAEEAARRTDVVLKVADIERLSGRLGSAVTYVKFEDAMHDLTLSAPAVRAEVFRRLDSWATTSLVPPS
jgi:alpha-beta hydrolase superfamily lysophospholipase